MRDPNHPPRDVAKRAPQEPEASHEDLVDALHEIVYQYSQRFYVKGRGLVGPIDSDIIRARRMLIGLHQYKRWREEEPD